MSEIKIDKGVPYAPKSPSHSRYPWKELDIGDSFFVAGIRSTQFGNAMAAAKKRTGYRLSQRTVTENGVKGVRVWRIE